MGLFGALETAIGGLQSQSYALQNISGNIANSETIAYKSINTGFYNMIPDLPTYLQTAGSVSAFSLDARRRPGGQRDRQGGKSHEYRQQDGLPGLRHHSPQCGVRLAFPMRPLCQPALSL